MSKQGQETKEAELKKLNGILDHTNKILEAQVSELKHYGDLKALTGKTPKEQSSKLKQLSDEQLTRVHKLAGTDRDLNPDPESQVKIAEKLQANKEISRKEKLEDLKQVLESRTENLKTAGKQSEIALTDEKINKIIDRKTDRAIADMDGRATNATLDISTDKIKTLAPSLSDQEIKTFREQSSSRKANFKKLVTEAKEIQTTKSNTTAPTLEAVNKEMTAQKTSD